MSAAPPHRRISRLQAPITSPGTLSTLSVVHYGTPGARPKAYLQGSLHADEIPGMLVLEHLLRLLDAAAARIVGEVVVVPVANPLGLAQQISGRVLGRYALTGAGNYNRLFPDLAEAAAVRLTHALGSDPQANVAAVRTALRTALAAVPAHDETQWLRHTLLGLALDADIVLDLHCDCEALLHVYTGTPLWPGAADLSAQLGSHATLLAEASGGHPFDEAVAAPWWVLAARFAGHPIPPACLAATVELRGVMDVGDDLAGADARNLLAFLTRRGVLAGDAGALPEARCDATLLEAVDMVRAPVSGVVSRLVSVGARVEAGEVVAEIADPLALDAKQGQRVRVVSAASGVVFARTDQRIARCGEVLVKVAGREPLAHRRGAALLTD
jgi:hypothetical protein